MPGIAQRFSADTEAAFIHVRRARFASVSATLLTALELSVADGTATPTSFVLSVDDADATTARLVIDGDYVGRDAAPPLEFDVTVEPGTHAVRRRCLRRLGQLQLAGLRVHRRRRG